MKDTVWKLFRETGNPVYYLLYKELTEDGRNDKRNRSEGDGLQGK
ncbi:MAG: YqzL family protein [Clostridiales bacterium]|nr:YqzL family protein [Clostridiales bacterium]